MFLRSRFSPNNYLFIGILLLTGTTAGMNNDLTQAQKENLYSRLRRLSDLEYIILTSTQRQRHPQIPNASLPYIPQGCNNFKKDINEDNFSK
jgi:hypothetical protein